MYDDQVLVVAPRRRRRSVPRWLEYVLVVTALAVLATGVVSAVTPRVEPVLAPHQALEFPVAGRSELIGSVAHAAPAVNPASNGLVQSNADPDDLSTPAGNGRCPAPPPAPTGYGHGAWAKSPRVHVYRTPGAAQPVQTLRNPTRDGMIPIFLVREARDDWLLVQISQRPNGSTGWVRRSEVNEYRVDYHAVVELCARRMTLYDADGRAVMREPVAVGSPRYPTPTGRFFVDYHYKTPNPRGAYGPWLLSIAGFSNVLKTFNGGIGQIAFHGTNRPGSVGRAVSHGCLRMRNDAITRLQKVAIAGTPVDIYP